MVREPAPSCARRRRLYYDPDYQHRARTPYLTNLYAPEIIINKRRKTRDIAVIYDSALTAQRTNGSRLIIALLPLLECKIAWPAINIYNAAPSLRLIFALGSRLFKRSRLDNAYRASRKNNELLRRFHGEIATTKIPCVAPPSSNDRVQTVCSNYGIENWRGGKVNSYDGKPQTGNNSVKSGWAGARRKHGGLNRAADVNDFSEFVHTGRVYC